MTIDKYEARITVQLWPSIVGQKVEEGEKGSLGSKLKSQEFSSPNSQGRL